MTENERHPSPPPSPTDVLAEAVREEIAALDEEERECRERQDRVALVAVIEARARIKLDAAATALRVEANLRQMVLRATAPAIVDRATAALAKLRGGAPAPPEAGDPS